MRPNLAPLALLAFVVGSATGCQSAYTSVPSAIEGKAVYNLPFPVGDSARLIQGNNGPWGHSGAAAYAFDFIMPIGSPVTAARGGQVVATESRYLDHNRNPGQENYVVIRHTDGTFGRYYHLTKDGALVAIGEMVAQGDTIARSGDTGASAGPHLHFDVTRSCAEWGCQTIAIRFANAGSDSLVQGHTYKAMPASNGGSRKDLTIPPG